MDGYYMANHKVALRQAKQHENCKRRFLYEWVLEREGHPLEVV
jgi:hypothetical protein